MRRGTEDADITSIHCTIHLLQLCVNDAVFDQRVVKDLVAKARRLATHFNYSALATTELKNLQTSNPQMVLV